jgi:chemotaxis protein CheD
VTPMIVGISDCRVTNDRNAVLTTYALGSCVAVAVHDPVSAVGGLLHYMLPEAALDRAKAESNPYMFADTGIKELIQMVCAGGANRRRLVVRIAGGAQVIDGHDLFQIGKRNYHAARKLLWKAGILVAAERVGGGVSRTVRLEVGTGRTWVREDGVDQPLGETRKTAGGA